MSWYYNDVTGQIFQQTGPLAAAENAEIWAEKHSPLGSQINFGPFATKAAAQAYKDAHPSRGPISGINSAAHAAAGGAAAAGDFLSRLGDANTWIRVGQVLIGLILIAVGVAKLTSAVPAATKIARAVR